MTTNDPADASSLEEGLSWRELAVARSLDSARTRAENRVQRFMDAAFELVNTGLGKDFTVQEVVERSGQSLRSFYQYFEGKHELLLALFEESVNSTADFLTQRLEGEKDPLERLHRFVVEYHELCRPEQHATRDRRAALPVMAEFAWQLLTEHPQQAARAFVPLVSMYEELLDQAAAAGAVRSDFLSGRLTGVVLQAIMFNAFSSTIGGATMKADDTSAAEELWGLIYRGIVAS
jgi:AcrR family transcriptional regulator